METIEAKCLEVLEQWCMDFKLIGSRLTESPRWSQILRHEEGYCLESTICGGILYSLPFTKSEIRTISFIDKWNWWKKVRTEYLINNHPTINPY